MHQSWNTGRVLIIGVTAVLMVAGLALIVFSLGGKAELAEPPGAVDALASSRDDCVTCHREESPGIV